MPPSVLEEPALFFKVEGAGTDAAEDAQLVAGFVDGSIAVQECCE